MTAGYVAEHNAAIESLRQTLGSPAFAAAVAAGGAWAWEAMVTQALACLPRWPGIRIAGRVF
jgi:hypothetical protein